MMNAQMEFTWKTALQAADLLVFRHTGKYLSDIEITILQGAWDNRTYEQIAEAEGYTSSYLCRDVGCKLWGNLSTALKEKVSKKNFKAALQREWKNCTKSNLLQTLTQPINSIANPAAFADSEIERSLRKAKSLANLDSAFYVERSPIESICYETILKPGSLIRIKGAKWMGKTALIERILERAAWQQQKTVYLDFSVVKREIAEDLGRLLRWISLSTCQQLELQNQAEWDWYLNSVSDRDSTFWENILAETKSDVILALDNLDCLFAFEKASAGLLNLLASWHEQGKKSDCWSRLKFVLSHSTKTSISPHLDGSILNAGVPILLEEFSCDRVKMLADLYQIDLDELELSRIMNEVGGHPYLAKLAMWQMKAKSHLI